MRFLAWMLVGLIASVAARAADVTGTFKDESDDSMVLIEKQADGRIRVNMLYNDQKVILEGRMTGDNVFSASGVVDEEDKTSLRIEGMASGSDVHVRFWVSQNGKERSVGSTIFRRKNPAVAEATKAPEPPPRPLSETPPPSKTREPDPTIAPGDEVMLQRSPKAPGPALAFTPPEGFKVYSLAGESGTGLVMLSQHDGRADQDNIFVGALKLSPAAQGAALDDYFASDDFAQVKATLKARSVQRVKNAFWEGAALEGRATFNADKAPKHLESHTWVMTCGEYLVYFACNLFDWDDLSPSEKATKDQALQKVFRDVLMSVRKTE